MSTNNRPSRPPLRARGKPRAFAEEIHNRSRLRLYQPYDDVPYVIGASGLLGYQGNAPSNEDRNATPPRVMNPSSFEMSCQRPSYRLGP